VTVELLERAAELRTLAAMVDEATAGLGGVALISGEPGIGKTSLVRAFLSTLGGRLRTLVGACDDLLTPRAFGPLRDAVTGKGGPLAAALAEGDRDRVFGAVHEELTHPLEPTVLVIEDVHWADDATLDVLRYVVRRLADLNALVVLTYRDEDVPADHRLRPLLGLAAGDRVRRLPLRPLSVDAVARLSRGSGLDPAALSAATGGNPFYVTEAVAAPHVEVPATVVDAVLARMGELSPAAREACEQLAVVPGHVESWLAEALLGADSAGLAEAEERGVVEATATRVRFRHELARRAVEATIADLRRMAFHRRVLAVVTRQELMDLSRTMHHAVQAGHDGVIVDYGPAAAEEAARAGAHRQAVAHYRHVLAHLDRYDAARQAALLEGFAVECYTLGSSDEAVDARRRALELRRALGDDVLTGASLRWLSRLLWWSGERAEAELAAAEATAVLERSGHRTNELAMAYSTRAQLLMLDHRIPEALPWAERAVALAREVGDPAALSHALANLGFCRGRSDFAEGTRILEESLRTALDARADEHACRSYTNLTWHHLGVYDYAEARRLLAEALPFAERTEQIGFFHYLLGTRARLHAETGAWSEAEHDAQRVLVEADVPDNSGVSAIPALNALALVHVRRGDSDAATLLDRAWELAQFAGEPQRIGPVAAVRAEHAWLVGHRQGMAAAARPAYALATERGETRYAPELGYWLWKAGALAGPLPPGSPYADQAGGRWQAAAAGWAALGCPYEQALALIEGDADAVLAGLGVAQELGAVPLVRIARQRLRDLGVRSVPRGPRSSTLANPAGLTARQVEVLGLIARGLTNAQIAEELVLSVRTVDHHVAAILERLGVGSRREAAEAAARLGLPEGSSPPPTAAGATAGP
jgi:DNA-binding CsgD family transcriptional regulator/tetratricopeptide (TPR) repeat protein